MGANLAIVVCLSSNIVNHGQVTSAEAINSHGWLPECLPLLNHHWTIILPSFHHHIAIIPPSFTIILLSFHHHLTSFHHFAIYNHEPSSFIILPSLTVLKWLMNQPFSPWRPSSEVDLAHQGAQQSAVNFTAKRLKKAKLEAVPARWNRVFPRGVTGLKDDSYWLILVEWQFIYWLILVDW